MIYPVLRAASQPASSQTLYKHDNDHMLIRDHSGVIFLRQYSYSSHRSILPSLLVSTLPKKSSYSRWTILRLRNLWLLSSSLIHDFSSFRSSTLLRSLSCLPKMSSTKFLQQLSITNLNIISNASKEKDIKGPTRERTEGSKGKLMGRGRYPKESIFPRFRQTFRKMVNLPILFYCITSMIYTQSKMRKKVNLMNHLQKIAAHFMNHSS